MGFIVSIGFNENGGASDLVRDFSDNAVDPNTVANLVTTIDSLPVDGFYGVGNGVSTTVEWTAAILPALGEPFTAHAEIYINAAAGDGYVYFRANHSYLFYDSVAGTIVGAVWDNSAGGFETTSHLVSLDTFVKVMLTYSDANKQRLYLDSSATINTNAVDCSPQDTDDLLVFNDGTDYFDGRIREFWIKDEELDNTLGTNGVESVMQESQGKQLTVTAHGWSLGELVQDSQLDPIKLCVFLVVDTNTVKVRIISGVVPLSGQKFNKVGHRFDTTKQHAVMKQVSTSPPSMAVFDGVRKFTEVGTEAKKVLIYDKDGLRMKGNSVFLTAASTIVAQLRWVWLDPSSGGFITSLPANPKNEEEHTFKDVDGSANAGGRLLTIAGNGNTIDGSATATIQNSYSSLTVVFNGSEWSIVQQQS